MSQEILGTASSGQFRHQMLGGWPHGCGHGTECRVWSSAGVGGGAGRE